MFSYKIALGVLALILTAVGYRLYFRDIFSGKTKPHAFSWLVWSLLCSIGFAAQVVKGGGIGAWVTGLTALICVSITILAFRRGTLDFPLIDKIALGGALLAIGLWIVTDEPLLSVILISIIDAIGYIPTFRKAYRNPYSETLGTWTISAIRWVLAVAALETYSLTTWLYPASLVATTSTFAVMLFVRRQSVRKPRRAH